MKYKNDNKHNSDTTYIIGIGKYIIHKEDENVYHYHNDVIGNILISQFPKEILNHMQKDYFEMTYPGVQVVFGDIIEKKQTWYIGEKTRIVCRSDRFLFYNDVFDEFKSNSNFARILDFLEYMHFTYKESSTKE